MKKLVVPISGLHCKACELLTEDKLKEIDNIKKVNVRYKTGLAEIFYQGEKPSLDKIKEHLEEIGYGVGKSDSEPVAKKSDQFSQWFSIFAAIIIIYWLINKINVFDLSGLLQGGFSWPLALLIGLIAGVSTCLALVGGLVLGLAANYSKNHPEASKRRKFIPHILFNIGRVGGFFILGGMLGLVGSAFQISVLANSIITIIVGFVILILGLKLLEAFPALNKIDFALPKSWGKKIKTNNPFLLGALTFFLPCGFTQAMQIYALGSGNFFQGGLIMALFAVGTAPGLLGIGGITSALGRNKSKAFFKVAGVVVVAFALFNLNNGYRLLQVSTSFGAWPNFSTTSDVNNNSSAKIEVEGGVRIIRMTESGRGYSPNRFTILKDQPVRWIIQADAPYSCASALVVPSLRIQKQLKAGENIIEFTPTKVGNIPFSCSMGMYVGNFRVVASEKELSSVDDSNIINQAQAAEGNSGACGGSCGGGSCGCGSNSGSGSCH